MGRVETVSKASCSSPKIFCFMILLLLNVQCAFCSTKFSLKPNHHHQETKDYPWPWSSNEDDAIGGSRNFDDVINYNDILADPHQNEDSKWRDSYFDELLDNPSTNNDHEEWNENIGFMEGPEPEGKSSTPASSSSHGRSRKRKWHGIDTTPKDVSNFPMKKKGDHAHKLDAVNVDGKKSRSFMNHHITRPRTRFTFPKTSVSVAVSSNSDNIRTGNNGPMDPVRILMKKAKQARNQSGAKEKSFLFPYRIPFPYVRSGNNEDAKADRNSNERREATTTTSTGQRRRIRVRRESGEVNSPTSSTEVDKQNKSSEGILVQETQVRNGSEPNAPLPHPPPHHHPSSNPIEILHRLNRLLERMLRELSQFGQKFTLRLIRMTERQDIDQMQEIMKDFEISPEKPIFFIAGGLRMLNSTRKKNADVGGASRDNIEEMLRNATAAVVATEKENDTSLNAVNNDNETIASHEVTNNDGSTITPILRPQSEPDPDLETTTSLPVEPSDDGGEENEGTTPASVDEPVNGTESLSVNLLREPQRLNRSSRSIPEFDEFDFLPISGRSARTENPHSDDEDFHHEDDDDDDDDEDVDDDDDDHHHHHRHHPKTKIAVSELTATGSSGEKVVDQKPIGDTKILSSNNLDKTSELQITPHEVIEVKVPLTLFGGNDQSVAGTDVANASRKNSVIVEDGARERVAVADESSSISLRKSSPSHISADVTSTTTSTHEGVNLDTEANGNLNLGSKTLNLELDEDDGKDTLLQFNSKKDDVDIAGEVQHVPRDDNNNIELPLEKSAGGSNGNAYMNSIQQRSFDASSSSSLASSANTLNREEDDRKLDSKDSRRNSVLSGSSEVGEGLSSTLNSEVVTPPLSQNPLSENESAPGGSTVQASDETRVESQLQTENVDVPAPSSVYSIRDTKVTDLTDTINPEDEIKVVQDPEPLPTPIPKGNVLVSVNSDTVPTSGLQEAGVVSPIVSLPENVEIEVEKERPIRVESSAPAENSEILLGSGLVIGETEKVLPEEEMKTGEVLKVQETFPLKEESQIMDNNASDDDKMPTVISFPPEKTDTISTSYLTSVTATANNVTPILNQDESSQQNLETGENGSIVHVVPGQIESVREMEANVPVLTEVGIEKEEGENKNVDVLDSPVVAISDRTVVRTKENDIGLASSSGDILTSTSDDRQVLEDNGPIDPITNEHISQKTPVVQDNVKITTAIEPSPEINVPAIDPVKNVREVEESVAVSNVDEKKQIGFDGHDLNVEVQEIVEPVKAVSESDVQVKPIPEVPTEVEKVVPAPVVEVVRDGHDAKVVQEVVEPVVPESIVKIEPIPIEKVASVVVDGPVAESTVEIAKVARAPVDDAEAKPVSPVEELPAKVEPIVTNERLEVQKVEAAAPEPVKAVDDVKVVAAEAPSEIKPLVVDIPPEVKPVSVSEENIQTVAEVPDENVKNKEVKDEKVVLILKVATLSQPVAAIVEPEPISLDSKVEAVKKPVEEVPAEPLVTVAEAVKGNPIVPVDPVIEPLKVHEPAIVPPLEVKVPEAVPVSIDFKIEVVKKPSEEILPDPLVAEADAVKTSPIVPVEAVIEPVKVQEPAIVQPVETKVDETVPVDLKVEAVSAPMTDTISDPVVLEKLKPIEEKVVEPESIELATPEKEEIPSAVVLEHVKSPEPEPVIAEAENPPLESTIPEVIKEEEVPLKIIEEAASVGEAVPVVPSSLPEPVPETIVKNPEEEIPFPVSTGEVAPIPDIYQAPEVPAYVPDVQVPEAPVYVPEVLQTPETPPVFLPAVPLVIPEAPPVAPVSLVAEPTPVDDSIIISNIPPAEPDSHFGVKPIDTLPHLQIPGINRPHIPDRPHPDDYLAFLLKDVDSTPPLYFAPAPSPVIITSPPVLSTYSPEAILRKQQNLMKNYFSGFYRRAVQA